MEQCSSSYTRSIHLIIHLFIHTFIHLFIYSFIHLLFFHFFIFLFFHFLLFPSVYYLVFFLLSNRERFVNVVFVYIQGIFSPGGREILNTSSFKVYFQPVLVFYRIILDYLLFINK